MDLASASGLLCQLIFHVRYLVMGGGHVARSDGKTSGEGKRIMGAKGTEYTVMLFDN